MVGIVEQTHMKRMKKFQEEMKVEEATLQAAHLAKLRRMAAAESARDESAKQTVLTWLQSSATTEEQEMLQHWQGRLQEMLSDRVQQHDGEVSVSTHTQQDLVHDQIVQLSRIYSRQHV